MLMLASLAFVLICETCQNAKGKCVYVANCSLHFADLVKQAPGLSANHFHTHLTIFNYAIISFSKRTAFNTRGQPLTQLF